MRSPGRCAVCSRVKLVSRARLSAEWSTAVGSNVLRQSPLAQQHRRAQPRRACARAEVQHAHGSPRFVRAAGPPAAQFHRFRQRQPDSREILRKIKQAIRQRQVCVRPVVRKIRFRAGAPWATPGRAMVNKSLNVCTAPAYAGNTASASSRPASRHACAIHHPSSHAE